MSSSEFLNEHRPTAVGLTGGGVKVDAEILQSIAIGFDVVFILSIGFIADHLILGRPVILAECTIIAIVSAVIFVSTVSLRRGYTIEALVSPQQQLRQIAFAWVAVFFIVGWFAFLLKISGDFSRLGVLFFFATASSGLALTHIGYATSLRARLRSGRVNLQRAFAVIIGDPSEYDQARQQMRSVGIDLVGCHIIASNTRVFTQDCVNLERRIRATLSEIKCDAVLVFAPWDNQRRIDELLETIRPFPTPAVLMADRTANRIVMQNQIRFGTLNGFEVQRAPLSRVDRMLKRAFDVSVASAAIVLLALPIALTSLAILFESGRPILFRQDRKGFGGRVFEILKFRSMTVVENGTDVQQAQRNDRRVTPLGRVLRRTSIDELPQFFNVLRGDMSIVGPRPHALAHDNQYDELIAIYAYRHHVKPGITGWAQINGYRGGIGDLKEMEARVEHDLWYINHWSIWLDLRIVLQTAALVLLDKNAY